MTYDDNPPKDSEKQNIQPNDSFPNFIESALEDEVEDAEKHSSSPLVTDPTAEKDKTPPVHRRIIWEFVVPFFVTAVTYFFINYPAQKQQVILKKFDKLAYTLKSTIDWNEAINRYCYYQHKHNDPELLNRLILSFYSQYSQLLNYHADLYNKHYLSKNTYHQIHTLTEYQNIMIAKRAQAVCERTAKTVKSDKFLDKQQKQIQAFITRDRKKMNGLSGYFRIVKNYILWGFILVIIFFILALAFIKKLRTNMQQAIKSFWNYCCKQIKRK